MIEIQTSKSLIKALEKASERELSAAEIHAQQVSFIMGTVGDKSGITREHVERELAKQAGEKL